MSEQHRVAFTTLGSAKKQAKSKPKSDSVRITINLTEPSGDSCPVFSYTALVNSVERKKKKDNDKVANGSIDHIHDCDEEQLKRIAAQYEDKYGTKEKRFSNYNELGAGYDDGDSFIDNSEALDEALSEQVEPEFGGYYVNIGPLQLKHLDGSENSEDEEINMRTHNLKRAAKAIVSDSEESEKSENEEEEEEEDVDKDDSREENHTATKHKVKIAETKDVNNLKSENVPNETDQIRNKSNGEIRVKKQKRKLDPSTDNHVEKKKKKLSKSLTVKKLLEEKRIADASPECSDKETLRVHSSVNDVIESVILASRTDSSILERDSDISNGSRSSSSLSRNGDMSDPRDKVADVSPPSSQVPSLSTSANQMNLNSNPYIHPNKDIVPLPAYLPDDVLEIIKYIKQYPTKFQHLSKGKFFSDSINKELLRLECKSRDLDLSRHQIYAHLACFVPCGKETLMKRAKNLLIDVEGKKLESLIKDLKVAVDRIMPSILEKHSEACQKASKEKYIEDSVSGCASSNSETRPKTKVPRRSFPWNDELKSYVRQILEVQLRIFKLVKSRKDTIEDFVQKFVANKLKPLWPHGWMKVSTILKVADLELANFSKKNTPTTNYQKKINSAVAVNNSSTPVSTNSTPTPLSTVPEPTQLRKLPAANSVKDKFKETSLPEMDMFSDPIDLLSKITSAISPNSQQNCKASTSPQLQTSQSPKEKLNLENENKKTETVISRNNFNIDHLMDLSKRESCSRSVPQYSKSNDQVLDLSPGKTSVSPNKTPETVSAASYTSNNSSRASFSANFVPASNLSQVPPRTSLPPLPAHASLGPHLKHLNEPQNPMCPPMPISTSSSMTYFKNVHYTNSNSHQHPLSMSPSFASNAGALHVSPVKSLSVSASPLVTSSYEVSADRGGVKNRSCVSRNTTFVSPPTSVSSHISPKEGMKPVSLKHRILQESMKAQAESDSFNSLKKPQPLNFDGGKSEPLRLPEEKNIYSKAEPDYQEDSKKSTYENIIKEEKIKVKTDAELEAERRMIEETMTATDVLNRIINESLQDPSPVVHDDIKPLQCVNEMKPPPPAIIKDDPGLQERKVRSQSVEECEASMEAVIKSLQDLQKMSGNKINTPERNFSMPHAMESVKLNNNIKPVNLDFPAVNHEVESPKESTGMPKVALGFQAEFYKHLLSDSPKEKTPSRGPEVPELYRSYEDSSARLPDPIIKIEDQNHLSQESPHSHR
nr:PREDICTED: ubinuclein-1 isoform X2 [Bemisia tabaci]